MFVFVSIIYPYLYTLIFILIHIINKLLHGWFVWTIFIVHSLWRIAKLTRSLRSLVRLTILQVPLRRKIVDPIWNASEQHFQTSLNGVFSFSISFSVLEIFRFFKTCKLGVSDIIYSRIINYIYKIVNISVNNKQNSFKLCMRMAIW